MVTATNAIATFVKDNGETQSVSFYIADVVGTDVKWNLSALSTSTNQAFITASRNMLLRDIAITTGPTVTKVLIIKRDDVPVGNVVSIAQYLDSLNSRPPLNIPYRAGAKITFTEA